MACLFDFALPFGIWILVFRVLCGLACSDCVWLLVLLFVCLRLLLAVIVVWVVIWRWLLYLLCLWFGLCLVVWFSGGADAC